MLSPLIKASGLISWKGPKIVDEIVTELVKNQSLNLSNFVLVLL